MKAEHEEVVAPKVNLGALERVASIAGGAALIAYGLRRRARFGNSVAWFGGSLVVRGLSGWCGLYALFGVDRSGRGEAMQGNLGVKVEREMVFEEPAEKLYAFWRDFRNLPTIMPHVESVSVYPDGRSHWRVKGPLGAAFEWDARIINDVPNEVIAWRTEEGARVQHAGSVRFERLTGDGTLVRVSLQYHPPGGELAHLVTALFGADPGVRIEDDLMRLREAMARANEDRDGMQPATTSALGYQGPNAPRPAR
jgi:uncharacterized membrane protein